MYTARVKTKSVPANVVMNRETFQRLWRVMMAVGARYNAEELPRGLYEDIQKVVVWMDNTANRPIR